MAVIHGVVLLGFAAAASGSPSMVLDDAGAIHDGGMQCTGAGHAGAFHHNNGSLANVTTFATYDFNVTKSGCYLIEEYHPASDPCGNRPLQYAPLRVDYCKGMTAWASINQGAHGGAWNKLGRLPFYVDWPGRIALTREGLPEYVCPRGQCFWVADAFRLTWLAGTCHEAEVQASERPTAREQAEAELEGQEPPEAGRGDLSFRVQAVLREPVLISQRSTFAFQPPLDGCYVVEEHHPHVPGASEEPLEIGFCRGLVAHGVIDHTDGRHLQWNYVASLPFFDDREGSVTLSQALLERAQEHRGDHEFRLTHVGPWCSAPAAQVHRAVLRIAADFGLVRNRLHAFKDELAQLLASNAGVEPDRLRVSHLQAGSIIAEVTVLPAASVRVQSTNGPGPSAAQVVASLREALDAQGLAAQVCAATSASAAAGCSVSVEHAGPVEPLAKYRQREGHEVGARGADGEGGGLDASLVGIIVGCSVAIVLLCAVGVYVVLRRRRAGGGKRGPKQVEDPQEEVKDPKQAQRDAPAQNPDPEQPSGEAVPAREQEPEAPGQAI